jgi:hypothetical protein
VGVGPGQTNRVTALELCIRYAGDKAKGSVMGSDAFFPFSDCVEMAEKAGVTAIIQRGLACATKRARRLRPRRIAMVFTGTRTLSTEGGRAWTFSSSARAAGSTPSSKSLRSPPVRGPFTRPGNGGIAADAVCVDVKATDVEGIVALAKEKAVGLVVVPPTTRSCSAWSTRSPPRGISAFVRPRPPRRSRAARCFQRAS